MKKIILISVVLLMFFQKSFSQNLLTFEYNPILNNIFSIELELYKDSSLQINHYIHFWEIDHFQDSLGQYYNHIDLGGNIFIPIYKNVLNTKLSFAFGNGNYHSGGGDFRVLENASFGLDINYSMNQKIELNLFGYSSIHLSKGNGKRALIDRYRWNYSLNYRLSNLLKLGLILEQYFVTETKPYIKITYSKYLWAGPTATLNLLSNRLKIQSSLGADFIDYIDSGVAEAQKEIQEFYKIIIQYTF